MNARVWGSLNVLLLLPRSTNIADLFLLPGHALGAEDHRGHVNRHTRPRGTCVRVKAGRRRDTRADGQVGLVGCSKSGHRLLEQRKPLGRVRTSGLRSAGATDTERQREGNRKRSRESQKGRKTETDTETEVQRDSHQEGERERETQRETRTESQRRGLRPPWLSQGEPGSWPNAARDRALGTPAEEPSTEPQPPLTNDNAVVQSHQASGLLLQLTEPPRGTRAALALGPDRRLRAGSGGAATLARGEPARPRCWSRIR